MQIRNNLEEQTPSGHWDRANFDSWLMLFYNNVAQKRHNYGHKLFAHLRSAVVGILHINFAVVLHPSFAAMTLGCRDRSSLPLSMGLSFRST